MQRRCDRQDRNFQSCPSAIHSSLLLRGFVCDQTDAKRQSETWINSGSEIASCGMTTDNTLLVQPNVRSENCREASDKMFILSSTPHGSLDCIACKGIVSRNFAIIFSQILVVAMLSPGVPRRQLYVGKCLVGDNPLWFNRKHIIDTSYH